MIIFALDDEPLLLSASKEAIHEAMPEAVVLGFSCASDALKAIEEGVVPCAVFSDIEMPGMNGISFAAKLKQLSPHTKIIFTTAYSEYAVEAYRIHADGYIMKPLDPERIKEELEMSVDTFESANGKLQVRCFGYFEVFYHGKPLTFKRRKTKEMLAFLIDREGAVCTSEEIATALWEDAADMKKGKDRVRHLIQDLNITLRSIGMDDVLLRKSGCLAIIRDKVDCDYYRMLSGDIEAINSYYGEYMNQYSWAEVTTARLTFM